MSAPNFHGQTTGLFLDVGVGILDGYVQLDASANVVTSYIKGVSVAHTSTGVYTFTFTNACAAIKFADLQIVSNTAVDLKTQIKSITPATAGVSASVAFNIMAGSTLTNPPANGGLLFIALPKYSKVS